MQTIDQGMVTQLLDSVRDDAPGARERLWDLVYSDLRRIAKAQMARESAGKTLQPTALVHETYLRLFGSAPIKFENQRHFYAAAAKAMRHILVDGARSKGRLKRGGLQPTADIQDGLDLGITSKGPTKASEQGIRRERVPLDDDIDVPPQQNLEPLDILAVDDAMQQLESHDAELAEVVHLRYFAGLSVDESADVLGVAARTVDNRWRLAKAWLHRALAGE